MDGGLAPTLQQREQIVVATKVAGPSRNLDWIRNGPPALDRDGVNAIVWQAGGAVIGSGGLPNIAVAAATRPDFAQALMAAGAWLVLPSPRLLGCFSESGGIGHIGAGGQRLAALGADDGGGGLGSGPGAPLPV